MKITVIGTGYVGLVSATCFAEIGHEVMGIDIDKKKIEKLKKGISPIYELGLDELLQRNLKEGGLQFDTDVKKGIEFGDIVFCAVGTPSNMSHGVNLEYVEKVAKDFGQYANNYKLFINKSTVSVGTGKLCHKIIKQIFQRRKVDFGFDVVSNPEFLREGCAIKDTMEPDRIVVGSSSKKAQEIMQKVYSPIAKTIVPWIFTNLENAEIIKYASNAFLATKISFINQVSNFCEKVDADITTVAMGIGLDKRIGSRFLHAGIGYGGSCFPKDVKAFIEQGKNVGCHFNILEAVEQVNQNQKEIVFKKLISILPSLAKKTIGIWGLSFKPKTDDMREAPSIVLIKRLVGEGAKVRCYDPVAIKNAKEILHAPNITFATDAYDAATGADVLIILTEWDTFRAADISKVKTLMKGNIIIDGRNILEPEEMTKIGLSYISIGRPNKMQISKSDKSINRAHGKIKTKSPKTRTALKN